MRENLLLGDTVQHRRGCGSEVREDLKRVYRLFPVLRDRIERRLSSELGVAVEEKLVQKQRWGGRTGRRGGWVDRREA
ncbi:MAG TPA: hypothetical protein VFF02_02605 [Anaeromyxobacteraceae bacterium]|nr:hypothetical protein [Anaeromyxobacteraceae bacterium]